MSCSLHPCGSVRRCAVALAIAWLASCRRQPDDADPDADGSERARRWHPDGAGHHRVCRCQRGAWFCHRGLWPDHRRVRGAAADVVLAPLSERRGGALDRCDAARRQQGGVPHRSRRRVSAGGERDRRNRSRVRRGEPWMWTPVREPRHGGDRGGYGGGGVQTGVRCPLPVCDVASRRFRARIFMDGGSASRRLEYATPRACESAHALRGAVVENLETPAVNEPAIPALAGRLPGTVTLNGRAGGPRSRLSGRR